MKDTAEQSAALKQAFKAHFRQAGYNAPLPPHLEAERKAFPLEYGEACSEFEEDGE